MIHTKRPQQNILLNSMNVQNLNNASDGFIHCSYPKGLHWKTLGCWIQVAKKRDKEIQRIPYNTHQPIKIEL